MVGRSVDLEIDSLFLLLFESRGEEKTSLLSKTHGGKKTPIAGNQRSIGTVMKQILVVDDSATMRRMVRASLQSLPDVTFGEASTGLEAIEQLAISSVDLIVLDLNMPDMHGLEAIEFVRGHDLYRAIPIVVLTTRGDDNSRERAMSAGASRYLTKPFDPRTLAREVLDLLKQPIAND